MSPAVADQPIPIAGIPDNTAYILTPPPPSTPRINGPAIYGERVGRPFFYAIPATGERPMTFAAIGLPLGLTIDPSTGYITGSVAQPGSYVVQLGANNALGSASKEFKIVIGDQIALTPPMGWNSYNVFSWTVDQNKVLSAAQAMVYDGLAQHGWTYINTDDTWQGTPDPKTHALQGNDRFPDMGAMVSQIHALGLKAGIYSTPWIGSYSMYPGGSADTPDREWNLPAPDHRFDNPNPFHAFGKYSFATADADQFAAWGFDYLKYDWNPIDPLHVIEMSNALKSSGRGIVFSLSNGATLADGAQYAQYANLWRTSGDIIDNYESVCAHGFTEGPWAPFEGPGHWNDPDMMTVGEVGWGTPHPTNLSPDEQYTHVSLWCLLSAPLLLGCDLTRMDPFTTSLLTNDEVLAIDQDALGKQAVCLESSADSITLSGQRPYAPPGVMDSITLPRQQVWGKPLADGSFVIGLFNLGPTPAKVTAEFDKLGLGRDQMARDLWRQQDLGLFHRRISAVVAAHGVVLVKLTPTP